MVKLSGGGIQSNKYVTSKSGQKVEPKARAARPGGINQMGVSTAFKKEDVIAGKGYEPKRMGDTGIAKAEYNSNREGPGSGRTIYRSGSQGVTPPATEMPKGHDILSDYGPEKWR